MGKNKYLALLGILAVTCLPVSLLPAWALEEFKPLATLQNAATATGNGAELDVALYNTVTVYVSIATTATVTFEGTADGSAWDAVSCVTVSSTSGALVTTATATTSVQCPVAGLAKFRVRISSWTSGAVTVKARATTASISKNGGGQFDTSGNLKVMLGTTLAGEDTVNDVLKTEQRFTYTNITLAAPTCTTVKSGPGYLQALTFNKPVATGVATLYDNTACSGTIIGTITTPTSPMPVTLFYHVTFGTGLSINTATAAQDITVSSR